MIEQLDGIHETVHFPEGFSFKIYRNLEQIPYPVHWHTPVELIIPTEHTYHVTCSNEVYELNVGDILIIAPGTLHSIAACQGGSRYIMQVDFSVFNQFRDFGSLTALISPCLFIAKDNSNPIYKELSTLIFNIVEEYHSAAILANALIYSKLILLFVIIGRSYANTFAAKGITHCKQQKYTEKFLSVCEHINIHCTENITLDEAAAYAGFSKYHFTRLFKDYTGISFYKYLNKKRILSAQLLLIDPDLSVTEVASRSGYTSLSAFIRMFKLCLGCTPSEYRSLHIQ